MEVEEAGPSEVKTEPDDFMFLFEPSELKVDDDELFIYKLESPELNVHENEFMYKSEEEDQSEHDDNDSNFSWNEDSGIDEADKVPSVSYNLTEILEPVKKRKKIDHVELIVNWLTNSSDVKQIPFTAQPGLRVELPNDPKPIDYFYMLADDSLLDLICTRTNANAEQIFLEKGEGRISSWRELTKTELKIFLGLLFHMGMIQCFRIQDYWKTHRLYGISCFHKYMKRNRFLLILKCINFAPIPTNEQPAPQDRLYQLRPIMNYFNEKMATVYTPQKQLYLDEPMVLHRGRLLFQRCIKKENYNCGIKKLYTLIDSHGVIINFAVCTGIMNSVGGAVHSYSIVLNLMQKKLHQGYSLHLDKFYSTFTLARQLLNFNTYCTGLLHPGRKSIPEDVANAKLNTGESICRYAEGVFIGKWHDKRDFLYISTEHASDMVTDTNYKRDSKNKPKPIVEFNKCIPSIDFQEQMMSYYPFARKTIGWYEKLGFHMIHMMLFNAYLLHNRYSGKKMPFYDFRLSIVEELLPVDQVIPPPGLNKKRPKTTLLEHFPSKCLKNEHGRTMRRRCKNCWRKNVRKDTQYLCTTCRGSPGLCLEPCFKEFHANIK